MTPAAAHIADVGTICRALQTQIQAVKLTDAPDSPAAFQRVELFDSDSLIEAVALLGMSEQRICVIVPLDEAWESAIQPPRKQMSRRVTAISLLISDRILGRRHHALFGTDQTPGAYRLAARVLPAVTGQLLPNPAGVVVSPTVSSVILIKNEKEKQNLPGRAVLNQELHCQGGWIEAGLGVGVTL